MDANITGIGWVTATGMGCGRDLKTFQMTDAPFPDKLLDDLPDRTYPSSRRMDRYSRLGLAAITYTMIDAGLDKWSQKRNIGIVVATEYGCLNTDIDYFDTVMPQDGIGASPALFAYTLPSVFLGEAAIRFGLTGPPFAINDRLALGPASLQLALESIACGETDKMLGGVCHPQCPAFFDEISTVAQGALFFMLETSPRKGASYGELSLSTEGRIKFKGTVIEDLSQLVRQCLAGGR